MIEFLSFKTYFMLTKMSLLIDHLYYCAKFKFTNDAYVIEI